MIGPTGAVRVMVATKPVDFRKGAEGLAALVREADAGRSVLRRRLCLPRQAGRPGEADLLGRHGRVPVCQAAGGWRVPLAEHAGRRHASDRGAALGTVGRARLAAGSRGAGDRGAGAAELICGRVNQPDRKTRDARQPMI